ncbi:MAG: ABC transporter substrate-binding protein [Planctomycetes bacterium]|nr:ABC transporter substrate-binding protein [Planctomycetota bacterium]
MEKWLRLLGVMIILMSLFVVTACDDDDGDDSISTPPATKGPIVVGSKIDTEGALLASMIILVLEDNRFDVTDKSQTGATAIVRAALESGEIDMYPEYTGNGAFFFDEADSDVWKDAKAGYERVAELDKEKFDIVWLEPAPANNTWAIAVPQELAKTENLASLEDFAAYANGGGYIKLIGSEEFVTSPAALPSFQEAYGFTLSSDQLVTVSGGNTALTEKAAAEGTDGVNAAMAYGTDGQVAALGLVILSDPLGAQPVYEPTPRVRGEIIAEYPEIADILNPVFKSLGLETLQSLNAKIAVEGQIAMDVAQEYLVSAGFLAE